MAEWEGSSASQPGYSGSIPGYSGSLKHTLVYSRVQCKYKAYFSDYLGVYTYHILK